jgi:endonuclease/exonuclease/phosphatase family metal-dependent hydrolase
VTATDPAPPADGARRHTLRVASFNAHMGVDGWGRYFDVVAECRALDADVLVLQEAWTPDDGSAGTAALVATSLGYHVVSEAYLARARLYAPIATATTRWGPSVGQVRKTLRLDQERWKVPAGHRDRTYQHGRWGVSVLARVVCGDAEVLELGKLRRDGASRAVVRCTTDLDGRRLVVHGTHMSHITHLSPTQYRRLARLLPPLDTPAVLAGDMNMWGPPASSFFSGWRRAVIGRTWPSHRPHSQLDHILVTPSVQVVDARVATSSGSDHRPVVATLALA